MRHSRRSWDPLGWVTKLCCNEDDLYLLADYLCTFFLFQTVSNKARRQTSFASSGSRGEHSSLSGFPAPSQSESNLGRSEKSFLSSTSSLSFAINRSRNALKRKSSFLGNNSQKAKAMKSGGISLGSVFFAGDAPSSTLSRSASLPQKRSSSLAPPQKKHAASNTRGSLWSRVASNGFK